MATGATKWIWENSRASNGSLIVLLAIADECGKGVAAEMTTAELARKSRLSERAVQNAVSELTALGELSFEPRPGRGKRNRYALNPADSSGNPAESARSTETPQNLHPAESAGFDERSSRSDPNPAESAEYSIPDALNGSVVSGKRSKSRAVSETPRPDVDRLCEHLASRITANGSNRPNITKRWKDAARLMLDNDGRTESDVHKAIDWCQQHHFWHRNILSMEKLRQQYDRLVLDAKAERSAQKAASPRLSTTDQRVAQAEALKAEFAAARNGAQAS